VREIFAGRPVHSAGGSGGILATSSSTFSPVPAKGHELGETGSLADRFLELLSSGQASGRLRRQRLRGRLCRRTGSAAGAFAPGLGEDRPPASARLAHLRAEQTLAIAEAMLYRMKIAEDVIQCSPPGNP